MLLLSGQDMIVDAEQLKDLNGHAVFFVEFALEGGVQSFAEIDLAAGEFPGCRARCWRAAPR